ncbi:hypothetical protein A33M_4196 [Rhodovulum sp. PH10]|nr:hypothetical protein A33M_4196 [Rhodovulum sp. PH10]
MARVTWPDINPRRCTVAGCDSAHGRRRARRTALWPHDRAKPCGGALQNVANGR